MTMITPSYLGETIEYSSLHACRSTLEDPTALTIQLALTHEYDDWVDRFDAILTPPALGEAPPIETTGDPRCCTRWSLVGAPALTLPTGLGPSGLPLGTQLVGRIGADRDLIATALWLESVRPRPGDPPEPGKARR